LQIGEKEPYAVPLTYNNSEDAKQHDNVLKMVAFQDWCKGIDDDFKVESIKIQSVDMFGPRVGFIKFSANITDRKSGVKLPGIVFMRGGAVGIMIIIVCEEDRKQYTVLTVQPRAPVAQYNFQELPAGMLDGSGDFAGVAAKELKEETSIAVNQKELVDLTELAYNTTFGKVKGVFPSCGGCDEFLRLFLYRTKMPKEEINKLQGKCTGVLEEGEIIKLKIISINDLW
jgi:ADP-sugar diphosphatase